MSRTGGLDRVDVARCWAGFASLGAGLVHIAMVREHLAESWPHGLLFATGGIAQVGWALIALCRSTVPLPRLTAAATLAAIALWAASRTTGVSLGPSTAVPEPVGTSDLLSVVLEIALILCVLAAMPRPASAAVDIDPATSPSTPSGRVVALLAAGALAVSAIATPAMAATSAGQHATGHDH